jgi:hypothetical protein
MTSNIQDIAQKIVGENGELEPFVSRHNAKFVSLLLAHGYVRNVARNQAVNYATQHSVGTPIATGFAGDLADYYHHLLAIEEADRVSEEAYENAALLEGRAKEIVSLLRSSNDLTIEEKQSLVLELQQVGDQIEELTKLMEKLGDA